MYILIVLLVVHEVP